MNEDTQKKNNPSKQPDEKKGSSLVSNLGFAVGGFVAGAAVSSAFAMNDSEDIIETDPVEPEPDEPEDDDEDEIITEPDDNIGSQPEPEPEIEPESEPGNGLPHYTDAPVAHVSDSQSFAQAFADARQQVGPGGIFEWHGQVYGTYYANEWNSTTQDQRNDYWASVNAQAAHDEDWNPGQNTHQEVVHHDDEHHGETHHDDESHLTAANEEHLDTDPAPLVEVGDIVTEGGVTVAEVSIDGDQILVADTDGDGVIDTIGADLDGDGYVSAYEQDSVDALGYGHTIDVADLEEMGGHQDVDDPAQMAMVEPDISDYQPDGFDQMIAMEDDSYDDMYDYDV